MDTLIYKLVFGVAVIVLINLSCLIANIVVIVQTFRENKIRKIALRATLDPNNESKHPDPTIPNSEANQRFLRQIIKRLFINVEVLRKDSESSKIQHQLQIRHFHEEHEAAAHNWEREQDRLIRAVEKARRDKELCEMQWADDARAHEVELKSATEMMEAAEDIVELLEQQLADEERKNERIVGLMESEAIPTNAITNHFNWFGIAIKELTKSCFAVDDSSAPVKSILNPVEFPSQESFFACWDSQKGLDKQELENRVRSEIFVCLQNYIFRQAWFGVTQSIAKDDEDDDDQFTAEICQHIEESLGLLENGLNCVADIHGMHYNYQQEFRDWRLRTMKCLSYAPKPESPHGILEIAKRITDFFAPIPSMVPVETVRETFNQLAISAYEFVLLVRSRKDGDHGLLFAVEGDEFDNEWMEAVDFEHFSDDIDPEKVKGEINAGNEEGWRVAFTRAPALYFQLSHMPMRVVVKAQVVVFGNSQSGSPSTPSMSLSSQSPVCSTLSSPLLFSDEMAAENDEELACFAPSSSSTLEAASPSSFIPESLLSQNGQRKSVKEQNFEEDVQCQAPSTKTAELRKLVGKMRRDQVEVEAAGSLSAWVTTKSTGNHTGGTKTCSMESVATGERSMFKG